ncbi:beta-ketoacyl synthase N-terminal-like domain-containing protein [Aquimarina sp. W85]|uniref:beta-ketoacyl synthase N-terminal-like domain-containing protein n=1 Tax=Aquimarina rhodophyticola TaxID=3342246 RepID=UPI00366AAE7E
MSGKCYINGIAGISAQHTTAIDAFFEEIVEHTELIFKAIDPEYKIYIKPAAMRRMSKSVKMGVTASQMALEQAGITMPDAIITGTGMGCKQDSEKFLENILHNDEQFLTPILFIQSTHNTVGGQIALGLNCKAYNVTYVQAAASFEIALMDARLKLLEKEKQHILVGGIDEIAKNSSRLHTLDGHLKAKSFPIIDLFSSDTPGTIASEGATFMLVTNQKSPKNIAQILDVTTLNQATSNEVEKQIEQLLQRNDLTLSDIDAVILGNNGDSEFDGYYHSLQKGVLKDLQHIGYKHLVGEHHTVSSFAYWLGCRIFDKQYVPNVLKINQKSTTSFKTILLYNQYRGKNHSFAVIQKS